METETPKESEGLIDITEFMRIKLRVGVVTGAEAVPKSKKLMKLQVDLGAEIGVRQIIAGILQHYQPESMLGRRIIVIANLKPAKLAGLESQGMLLAASTTENEELRVILLQPDKEVPAGSVIS